MYSQKLEKAFRMKQKRKEKKFYGRFMSLMNEKKKQIDIESEKEYEDIFTKRGTVVSGSERKLYSMFQNCWLLLK